MGKSSVKRFGARYGKRVRDRVADIEKLGTQKCPYCKANNVKREAMGIWFCNKCDSKFTGKAYKVK